MFDFYHTVLPINAYGVPFKRKTRGIVVTALVIVCHFAYVYVRLFFRAYFIRDYFIRDYFIWDSFREVELE